MKKFTANQEVYFIVEDKMRYNHRIYFNNYKIFAGKIEKPNALVGDQVRYDIATDGLGKSSIWDDHIFCTYDEAKDYATLMTRRQMSQINALSDFLEDSYNTLERFLASY